MGFTSGTDSRSNAPLSFRFIYNGGDPIWPQPIKIGDFANSGEAVDGKYRISDLDFQIPDMGGSFFGSHFNYGRGGFGSSLKVIAYFGGTMEYSGGQNPHPQSIGTVGAFVATIHTGNVYNISYSDRLLRIRSKSRMAVLSSLNLQFPVSEYTTYGINFGSLMFFSSDLRETYLGSEAFYDYSDGKDKWKVGLYVTGTTFLPFGSILNAYNDDNTRAAPDISPRFVWAGTNSSGENFYENFEYSIVDGTYFGTLIGTINSDDSALYYGYADQSDADDSKVNDTTYVINRTMLKTNGSFLGSNCHFLGTFDLSGTPQEIMRYMLAGRMVTPLFTESDLDTTTFAESESILSFSSYSNKFIPGFKKSPIDLIKSVIETTQALFSVNANNLFEYRAYGPKNLIATIPVLGSAQIMHSSFDNNEVDFYNRFTIKYNWDGVGSFASAQEVKASNWSKAYDRQFEIESVWVKNHNEAASIIKKLKDRYALTFPHINIKTNFAHLGLEIGTLIDVSDANSGLIGRVLQVAGFSKNWHDRTIDFTCWDGELLYSRRGYAFWDDGTTIPIDGDETSSAVWGNTYGTINTDVYGSQFNWW